jgi:hypothetical protein
MRQRRVRSNRQNLIRLVLPASVVTAFLLFVFTASIVDETGYRLPWKQLDVVFPKFSHYKFLQTLPVTHLPTHPDDNKRIVAIGDIHGMNQSLRFVRSAPIDREFLSFPAAHCSPRFRMTRSQIP